VLRFKFSTRAGRVEIGSDIAHVADLMTLRSRFASASSLGQYSFEVDTDDLLVNLSELARWPASDTDVEWQLELLSLVEQNAADATALTDRLSSPLEHRAAAVVELNPATWHGDLTDFQTRDFVKLRGLSHGANFSVPGAGKTRVALALFESRRQAGEVERMLVVAPKSAFESWYEETEESFRGHYRPQTRTFEGTLPPASDILLINYERLPDARAALLQWLQQRPTLLVLDEAHRMKLGPAGAWGAVCLALGPYAARRLILTGTPAPNGARDLENVMGFVWPGQGRAAVTRAIAGGDLRTASASLRPLYARTTKDELGLPPLEVRKRHVELPPLHRELYAALLGQASARFGSSTTEVESLGRVLLYLLMAATTPALLAAGATRYEPLPYRVPPLDAPATSTLATLLRDLPQYELSPKYAEVLSTVAYNAERNRKTLIWSTFVRNLTSLGHLLSGFNPAVVHGGTPDREAELRRFRCDETCSVLLTNPATLGEGVSLHHVCHDAMYVDRDFAAGRFLQSVDRIHRLGLADDVETRVTVLIASETIDEVVEQRLAAKLAFLGGVLDDPAVLQLADLDEEPTASIGMDESDVKALLAHLRSGASS
jgi:SNF2 family DNA or RNA helicase